MPPFRETFEEIHRHAKDLESSLVEAARDRELGCDLHEMPFGKRSANGAAPFLEELGMVQQFPWRAGATLFDNRAEFRAPQLDRHRRVRAAGL